MATSLANTQSRAELSASRARIVAAADGTRRRLERDLHDGIQQRLVSLGLKAQMIQTMTPRPADNIQRELSLLADGLVTALDELREIARGIHPAVLSEAGLGPALEALARRSAVPVELDLNLGPPMGQQVEAAAYYTASEALANAAKHARHRSSTCGYTATTAPLPSRSATTASAAPTPAAGRASPASKTGSRRSAEPSRSSAPPATARPCTSGSRLAQRRRTATVPPRETKVSARLIDRRPRLRVRLPDHPAAILTG